MSVLRKLKVHLRAINYLQLAKSICPIINWLPQYNLQKLKGDLTAGISVSIMIIPQCLAFAALAGIPPQNGLYTGLTPGIVYAIFGSSNHLSMGPTATMGLFTSRFNPTSHPAGSSLLSFFVGLVLIAASILRLGVVTKYIPKLVISAFISSAAIIIMVSQLSNLFGLKNPPSAFYLKIAHFFKNIKSTNIWDLILGMSCILFLFFFFWLSKSRFVIEKTNIATEAPTKKTKYIAFFKKSLLLLCASRNALICLFSTTAVYIFYGNGFVNKFAIAGTLPQGLPRIQSPLQSVELNNNTMTVMDFLADFGPTSLIIIPTVQLVQTISIAEAFAYRFKYSINPTQELLALGMSNFVGSFFGGMPVCASFSRSAVNAMSGAQTPITGVFTSLVVLIGVEFLMGVFYFIPNACLAAIIFMAVITLIDFSVPRSIWRLHKIELVSYITAFVGCLYKMEMGVLFGTLSSLMIMLSKEVKPKFNIQSVEDTVSPTIQLKTGLSYPGMEALKKIIQNTAKVQKVATINLDVSSMLHVDYGVLKALKSLHSQLKTSNVTLNILNCENEQVRCGFMAVGLIGDSVLLNEGVGTHAVCGNPTYEMGIRCEE